MAYQKPAKFLTVSVGSVSTAATYSGGDPWSGNAIRWNAVLTVTSQPHSDTNSSPAGGFYDGRNIVVGDYVTTTGTGKTLKIYSISAQTASSVTCVLEDVNRTNTFIDETQNGDGLIPSGNGYVYEVVGGLPVLYPLPDATFGTLPANFTVQLIARFLSQAPTPIPYSVTIDATTSWGSVSGEAYTITIAASTHGRGIPTSVKAYMDNGTEYVDVITDVLKINKTTGDVIVSVPSTPDGRFAGKLVVR